MVFSTKESKYTNRWYSDYRKSVFAVLMSPPWAFALISVRCKVPAFHHHLDLLPCQSQLYCTFRMDRLKGNKQSLLQIFHFSLMVFFHLFSRQQHTFSQGYLVLFLHALVLVSVVSTHFCKRGIL